MVRVAQVLSRILNCCDVNWSLFLPCWLSYPGVVLCWRLVEGYLCSETLLEPRREYTVNGLNPGVSVVRICSVIVRVGVVLKRTVVGE